jgi:hypothetical protein
VPGRRLQQGTRNIDPGQIAVAKCLRGRQQQSVATTEV